MSGAKKLLYLFVVAAALWGVFHAFSQSGPDAGTIYKIIDRLYARSLEDVKNIMGQDEEKSPSGYYHWNFDSKDQIFFADNSISCFFQENRCVFVFYTESFYGVKKAAKRYQELLKGLSKKLGAPVRDSKGFLVWFKGDKKIGVAQVFLPGTEKGGVSILINERNFVLPSRGVRE